MYRVIYHDVVLRGGVLRLFQAEPVRPHFGQCRRALVAGWYWLPSYPERPPGVRQWTPWGLWCMFGTGVVSPVSMYAA